MRAGFEMTYNPCEAADVLTHWPALQLLHHGDL